MPFKVAILSDSESNQNWDDVARLIKAEGAQFVTEQGDFFEGGNIYTGQSNTFWDWASGRYDPAHCAGSAEPCAVNFSRSECRSMAPIGWRCILGDEASGLFPFFGAADSNTLKPNMARLFLNQLDWLENQAQAAWRGCITDPAYDARGVRPLTSAAPCKLDDGSDMGNYWIFMEAPQISFVFQNTIPNVAWATQAFADIEQRHGASHWKLCLWHGNHIDFNVGNKGQQVGSSRSLPYPMYRNCIEQGALIFNGNNHEYSRTCVLTDLGDYNVDGPSSANANRIDRNPASATYEDHGQLCAGAGLTNAQVDASPVEQIEIGPGRSFVSVTGIAGHDVRDYIASNTSSVEPQDLYRHDGDGWWATIYAVGRYCRQNCTSADLHTQNHSIDRAPVFPNAIVIPQFEGDPAFCDRLAQAAGALFITFNDQGDPFRAYGYFKTADIPVGTKNCPAGSPSRILDEYVITYKP